jgi:hypothetical protein
MGSIRHAAVPPNGNQVIRSFGQERTCTASGCDTRLSRYNPDDFCSVHRDQVPRQRTIRHWRP